MLLDARSTDELPALQRVRAHVEVPPATNQALLREVPRTTVPSIVAVIFGLRG